jgi:hypothetical protein
MNNEFDYGIENYTNENLYDIMNYAKDTKRKILQNAIITVNPISKLIDLLEYEYLDKQEKLFIKIIDLYECNQLTVDKVCELIINNIDIKL